VTRLRLERSAVTAGGTRVGRGRGWWAAGAPSSVRQEAEGGAEGAEVSGVP